MAEQCIMLWQNGKQRTVCGEECISIEADFAAKTWTFRINDTVRVAAGRYLLIRVDDLRPSESENGEP